MPEENHNAENQPPSPDESPPAGQQLELSREMSLFHVVMIGVGAMIGAGIFVLTGTAAGMAGPALILVFALNGFIALLTAMAYAELGSCFPEAGGGYLWVKEGLPQPSGFLSGWMSWFAHAVACTLYALAFGTFVVHILSMAGVPGLASGWTHALAIKGCAVGVVLLFTFINYRGASETGSVEAIVTIAKIVVIVLFLVTGVLAFFRATPESFERFRDFMPLGITGIVVAMGYTFIAFEGYEIIAQCGEELKDPKRNIPRSIFISLIVVVPIYILVAAVAIGAVKLPVGFDTSWQYLGEHGEMAMVRAADDFMWVKGLGAVIFLVGGIFSTMSALNATIYSTSRVSFAMGRDRNLPSFFGRIHPARKTPAMALGISAVFIVIMAASLPIHEVAAATDIMFLFLFMFVNVALINLRRHRPDLDRGFRVPFCPWLPLTAVVLNGLIAAFLFYHYPLGIPIVGGYIVVGIVIYLVYARGQEIAGFALHTLFEKKPWEDTSRHQVVVPIANPRSTPGLMRLAKVLARSQDGDVLVLNALRLPKATPLSQGAHMLDEARRILSEAGSIRLPQPVRERLTDKTRKPAILEVAKVCHHVPKAIVETVREHKADMVVVGWRGKTRMRDYFFGNILDETVMNTPCDVVMLSYPQKSFLETASRVLVPFITPRHSRVSFKVALAVAGAAGVEAVFMHVVRPDVQKPLQEIQERLAKEIKELIPEGDFQVKVVSGGNPEGVILLERRQGDLLVLGASEDGLLRRAFFGDIPESIAAQVPDSVILVKPFPGSVKSWFQQLLGSRRPPV